MQRYEASSDRVWPWLATATCWQGTTVPRPKAEKMSEDITRTDLTHEVPTGRAVVHRSLRQFEMVKVEAKMPGWLGGTTFKSTAHVHAGSPHTPGLQRCF